MHAPTLVAWLNYLLPFFYFICTYGYGRYFFRRDRTSEKWITPALYVTCAIHLLQVVMFGVVKSHFPLATVSEATGVLVLGTLCIYLGVECHLQVKTIGYFVLVPLFFLQLFASAFLKFPTEIPEILQNPLFILHAASAVFGCSALIVSAIASLLYLLLFYEVKRNRFGVLYNRLPALNILQNMNYRSALMGWLFLTIGLVVGIVWIKTAALKMSPFDLKSLISYAVWGIYALEIVGCKLWKWSGKRLAYLSLAGFAIVIFSLLGVNLLSSFHNFK